MGLLHDLLAQALAEPLCSLSWHRFFAEWKNTENQDIRTDALKQLAVRRMSDPRAESLRLTLLSDLTGDFRLAAAAAVKVLDIQPDNPDRLATYLTYPWVTALGRLQGRESFHTTIRELRLPEIAVRLERCASQWCPENLLPRVPQQLERIAIVVPHLGTRFHTPSMMMAQQCEVLARQGLELYVFSCQEQTPPDLTLFRGTTGRTVLPSPDLSYWQRTLPSGIRFSVSDSRYSLAARWQSMFPRIAGFDPDAIFLAGFFSPLAAALYSLRPVVGLSAHTLPPICPVDVWLNGSATAPATPAWGQAIPQPISHHHPYRMHHRPTNTPLTRANLGLPDKAIIWVTVGFRLQKEIKGEWAARMLELLASRPEVVWLLVGGKGELPTALAGAPAGRICALPTQADVGAVLQCADIYLNPPRMGGGFSVAEAMAEGLPVVTLAGSDGGDKVGELAVSSPETYFQRVLALTDDPALRAEMGAALKAQFSRHLDLAVSGPSLMAAFEKAIAAARDRLPPAATA